MKTGRRGSPNTPRGIQGIEVEAPPLSVILYWDEVESYFEALREELHSEAADAKDDRMFWQCQGALKLLNRLRNLREALEADRKLMGIKDPDPYPTIKEAQVSG